MCVCVHTCVHREIVWCPIGIVLSLPPPPNIPHIGVRESSLISLISVCANACANAVDGNVDDALMMVLHRERVRTKCHPMTNVQRDST